MRKASLRIHGDPAAGRPEDPAAGRPWVSKLRLLTPEKVTKGPGRCGLKVRDKESGRSHSSVPLGPFPFVTSETGRRIMQPSGCPYLLAGSAVLIDGSSGCYSLISFFRCRPLRALDRNSIAALAHCRAAVKAPRRAMSKAIISIGSTSFLSDGGATSTRVS